jgi:hypothetical protein
MVLILSKLKLSRAPMQRQQDQDDTRRRFRWSIPNSDQDDSLSYTDEDDELTETEESDNETHTTIIPRAPRLSPASTPLDRDMQALSLDNIPAPPPLTRQTGLCKTQEGYPLRYRAQGLFMVTPPPPVYWATRPPLPPSYWAMKLIKSIEKLVDDNNDDDFMS